MSLMCNFQNDNLVKNWGMRVWIWNFERNWIAKKILNINLFWRHHTFRRPTDWRNSISNSFHVAPRCDGIVWYNWYYVSGMKKSSLTLPAHIEIFLFCFKIKFQEYHIRIGPTIEGFSRWEIIWVIIISGRSRISNRTEFVHHHYYWSHQLRYEIETSNWCIVKYATRGHRTLWNQI